jgi:hypothetical protein
LNAEEQKEFLSIDLLNKDPTPFKGLFDLIWKKLPKQFTLTCVSVQTLHSLSLKMNTLND